MAVSRYYSSVARRTTLTADVNGSTTSMQVAATTGWPSLFPYTLLIDKDTVSEEIVTVTARSGTSLTVTRGSDGTTGVAHTAGASVEHGVSARDFTESRQHEDATENVHGTGAGSAVVGTTTAQTLTNKTLTSPTINSGTINNATVVNPTFTGDIKAPAAFGIEFEGTTEDDFETRLIADGPTADRVVTLPDATATLVGRDTTDTLTNKTVSAGILSGTTTNTGTISGGTVSGATITSGTLSNALNANSQKITSLGTPTLTGDAATKGYVDTTTVASAGDTMTGALAMGSNKITGLGTPTLTGDAATKGYVDTSISSLVDAAPGTLDTLNELAAALGDDPNFATTVTNSIATKVAKAGDTMTGNLAMSGGAKVTGLPTPSATGDAAPKSYADTKLALAGGTVTGNITMSSGAKVTGLPTPTASSDATSKNYIDTLYGDTAAAAVSAAAAASSASAASGSASAASGSASSASNSASAASVSASAALASENAAASSATSAASSAATVAATSDIVTEFRQFAADGSVLNNVPARVHPAEQLLKYSVLWLDAAHESAGNQTITNLGWGGAALNAQAGSTSGADSNDPKFLDWTGENYVYLPGVGGNFLSVPDEAALDITGDIDIRVQVALADWTPSVSNDLVTKYGALGQRSFRFLVSATTGFLTLTWSTNGTTNNAQSSTIAPSVNDGDNLWVRATLDVDNGASGYEVNFYTSTDGLSFTQLGTTITGVGTTSIFSSTATGNVGANNDGTANILTGKVYRAVIYSDLTETTKVLDVDTSVITTGAATSFTALTGQTVTINRSTSGRKAVAVISPVWLFGTDDYMEVADNDLLDFGATDSFTVLAVVRNHLRTANGTWIAKSGAISSSMTGWILYQEGATPLTTLRFGDGTNRVIGAATPAANSALSVMVGVRDVISDAAKPYLNGVAGTPVTDTTTGSLTNSEVLRVGRLSAAGTAYADMELYAVAVFRRVLSSGEITTLTNYFTGRIGG